MRPADIPGLARLVAACEHDDQQTTSAREVQSVPRPEINPHLGYFIADRLPVAEIACLGKTQAGGDSCLTSAISEGVKLVLKLLGLENSEHPAIVSEWIRSSSDMDF